MRLYDQVKNEVLYSVIVLLTYDEARDLRDRLSDLILLAEEPSDIAQHEHVNDSEYQHEVTISIYDDSNIKGFADRMKDLIENDI